MSTFIPQISMSDFRKLKVHQLKRLKSCEVYADGNYLFSFVNGGVDASGFLRLQTEDKCATANNVCGETLEQILESKQEVMV